MKTYSRPSKEQWTDLTMRPLINHERLTQVVNPIINEVKLKGDIAIKKYTKLFDGVTLNDIIVSKQEITKAKDEIPNALKNAIKMAYNNIKAFHNAQQIQENVIENVPGVKCWRKSVAIEKVGLYIPGGTAPLFSSILMLGIPAKLAGCKEIILCTPPNKKSLINPIILYTANLVGITKIFKVGGAQAIASMAFGTESVPQVNKIFGPGNQYVTKAKEIIQQYGIAIDIPAGPSEVLIIADDSGIPPFIAADLLAQAEHGPDSQVILLSNDNKIIEQTIIEINKQIESLPRKSIALKALENSKAIVLNDLNQCIEFSNEYAPEHLIIASKDARRYLNKITNAGSVFIGNYSCESAGDYASGTNHTLPTNSYAKSHSGVSLDSFVKKITYQEINKEGIKNIGRTIEIMAEAEELFGHKNAVTLRLNTINDV